MEIFRFDPEVGKSIDRYSSSGFIISRVVHLFDEAVVNCAYVSSGGVIGYHQATLPQLFLVVQAKAGYRVNPSSEFPSKQVQPLIGKGENGTNQALKPG
jgi:hypothetical protein